MNFSFPYLSSVYLAEPTYRFDSVAVKEPRFEIDGVFLPPESEPGIVYFRFSVAAGAIFLRCRTPIPSDRCRSRRRLCHSNNPHRYFLYFPQTHPQS